MTEPGSGPEQPEQHEEPSARGREFRRTSSVDGAELSAPEAEDEDAVESPDEDDIDGIVEALRAKVGQDPPSLGAVWDEVTQQTLAAYWPDED